MSSGTSGGGKRLGKYEVGGRLGSGNFSKVRLAIDTTTGTKFAMKIIEKELLVRQNMEEQLRREITLMRRLRHVNIVRLHEVMQTDNHIYLVMELVTGGELFNRIVGERRFSEDVARRYFRQLMEGLLYCHQLGVAHRDLKPENLLLDASDTLKITDFGLSNVQAVLPIPSNAHSPAITGGYGGNNPDQANSVNAAPGTLGNTQAMLHTVCGTPNYIAPEVLKERGYDGLKADIWSCGVVLYVMLAGYLPFEDETLPALFTKIERGQYRMSRSFSKAAADLIAHMLVVDPARRLSTNGVLAHPWVSG